MSDRNTGTLVLSVEYDGTSIKVELPLNNVANAQYLPGEIAKRGLEATGHVATMFAERRRDD